MNFKRRKYQHISGDTLQVFWEPELGKCRVLKQEKAWRMVEKKHRSQNRSEKWNQSTRKGSKEVFSAIFDNFRGKESQKLLPFWRVHTFIQMTKTEREANTVPCLHYLKMSWFDSLVWKSQKIKMSCYRSAGGNAVKNFQATCFGTDPKSKPPVIHLPSLIFTQNSKHKGINPANTQ